MRARWTLRPDQYLAIASGIVWGVLYLCTLTNVHTFDALSYIFDVSRKPWQESFHPHHLAYGPVGVFATWLAHGGDTAVIMQRINAIAGAAGVAVLVAIVGRRWQRSDLCLLAAVALGGGYAYWYYAVEVEVYTLATFFLILVIWVIETPTPRTTRHAYALGCAWAGAILFHQTNVLLALPLAVYAYHDLRQQRSMWRWWLLAGTTAFLLVCGAYAGVTIGVSGFRDLASIQNWLLQYAETGWWGGRGTLADLVNGVSHTVTNQNGEWYLVGTILLVLIHAQRYGVPSPRLWFVVWVLCYGAFFFWWEPDNIEFWIALTPVSILLVLDPLAQTPPWRWQVITLIGLAAWVATSNADTIRTRGDARRDLQRDIARAVAAHSQPADLLLIPDGLQELYLPYYEQRPHFLSINAVMAQSGAWAQACRTIHDAINQTQHAGAAVLMADDFLVPSLTMQQRFGLPPDAVRTCLASDMAAFEELTLPPPIPRHYLLPRPVIQLQRGAWRTLTHAPYGWVMQHARVLPDTPWVIAVDDDPAVISPILDMPLPDTIVIRMQADGTADQQAQLFVSDQIGQFSEAQSVRWTLRAGMHDYTIDLRTIAQPPQRLVQLRLDPVGTGAGGSIHIAGLWLP